MRKKEEQAKRVYKTILDRRRDCQSGSRFGLASGPLTRVARDRANSVTATCQSVAAARRVVSLYSKDGRMDGLDWGTYYFFQKQRLWPEPGLDGLMTLAAVPGSPVVLIGLALLTAAWLLTAGRFRDAGLFLGVFLGSAASAELIKLFVGRHRPPDWDGSGTLYSFPSTSALLAAVAYAALALVLVQNVRSLPVRVLVLALSAVPVLAAGASQLYLGNHFLTDILAGWAGGAAVLLLAARFLWPAAVAAQQE
jgi:membrane-associated phospholipid phosphatase